ncbi:hypothetical protein C0J52_03773 [Blattella germanica]|nr:hypothetical protein C0J52_03773 [Blattella germanica]
MDLSADFTAGLKLVGSSSAITEECFSKLLEAGVNVIIGADNKKAQNVGQLCNSKGDIVKESYAALLNLLVEAARHDVDSDTLSVTLQQDYNFSTSRNEKLVKASSLEQVGSFLYLIQFHTESCSAESVKPESGTSVNKLKFLCTQEELQDLVWKLRDAVRHVERLANP